MTYERQFLGALELRSRYDKAFRRAKPDFKAISKMIQANMHGRVCVEINEVINGPMRRLALRTARHAPELIGKCHTISHDFSQFWHQHVESQLCPLDITIGDVEFDGRSVYNVTRGKVKKTMQAGRELDKLLEVHVWLTAPNMTVVDLTIASNLEARGLTTPGTAGRNLVTIWRPGDESLIRFVPYLVHNRFMYEVDAIKPG